MEGVFISGHKVTLDHYDGDEKVAKFTIFPIQMDGEIGLKLEQLEEVIRAFNGEPRVYKNELQALVDETNSKYEEILKLNESLTDLLSEEKEKSANFEIKLNECEKLLKEKIAGDKPKSMSKSITLTPIFPKEDEVMDPGVPGKDLNKSLKDAIEESLPDIPSDIPTPAPLDINGDPAPYGVKKDGVAKKRPGGAK